MIEELRNKDQITRQDIKDLLASIGRPGLERAEKQLAIEQLNTINFQGISLLEDLPSYEEY